ncbi:thioredoxin-like protein [Phlebopus sp. FC_14]|nr:thioredoxin-like protein [Phlebopus sp. FC_14]
MATTLGPTKQVLRAQLRSSPSNGHTSFVSSIRKVVLEFCQGYPSSSHTRTFISNHLERVARRNPHVEFVVKQRNGHEPIARGFYANGRDKVIPLQRLEVTGIERKIQLLLDSSGAKIKPLKKGRIVESSTEATRGIWSGLHVDTPFKI